jgi:UDP-GlcNAc:undecaprenyl-phosphate GlcNAc-1-phosphate transferase
MGAIDAPGARRVHVSEVPRSGGLAVLAAIIIALFSAWAIGVVSLGALGRLACLALGTAMVAGVGMIDDLRPLGPWPKLATEIIASLIALAGGFLFTAVTNPFTGGAISLGPFGAVVTVVWIVGITNAINLIDGLDGLACGVAAIVSSTLVAIAISQEHPTAAHIAAALAGALLGFLRYNFHPASIFLGDTGALAVGYLLAVLAIDAQGKGSTAVVVLAPVLALALPIFETGLSLARRFSSHGPGAMFSADDDHIHHRLLRGGMTQPRAVLLLYAVCLALSGLAYLAVVVSGPANALLLAAVVVIGFAALRALGYGRTS